MTDPNWAYNLLRSDSVVDLLKKTTDLRLLRDLGKKYFGSTSVGSLETGIDDEADPMVVLHYNSLRECVGVNFLEGCLLGGSLAAGVACLPHLVKGRLRKALGSSLTKNNGKVAIYLGLFMVIFNSGVYLERTLPHRRRLIKILATLMSGSAMTLLPPKLRQFIVYLLFTRALEVAIRRYKVNRLDFSKPVPAELISGHESVALTVASMSVITTTWFGWPELVSKSYLHFLDNISNIDKSNFRDAGRVLRHVGINDRAELRNAVIRKKPCLAFHSDDVHCAPFIGRVFVESLITKTIPFYAKLYAIPFLFHVASGKLSLRLVKSTGVRLWWSGLFLGVLDTLVGGTVCALSNQHVVPHVLIMPLCGGVSGLSLYIEQPARRLELALYMFGQAVQMLVSTYRYNGLKYPSNVDVIVCAACMCVLADAFTQQQELDEAEDAPTVLRPTYANLLGKILDTGGKRHTFVLPTRRIEAISIIPARSA